MAEKVPISLECFEEQLIDYKKQDSYKKMQIAANVLQKCEQVQSPVSTVRTKIGKAAFLTGVTYSNVNKVAKMDGTRKKFIDRIVDERRKILLDNGKRFSYLALRNYLIHKYTKEFQVPTYNKDYKIYEGYRLFCTSLQLPGTKNSILVEKPETVLERHRFMYTKMMHREASRHLVYIGKINLMANKRNFAYKEDNNDSNNRFILAASPSLGYLNYVYCGRSNKAYLTKWIHDKIEPQLPRNSVIIFQENVLELIDETVSSISSKQHMINCLEVNDIPHDPTQHRAELYKLIQTHKAYASDIAPAEEILKANGFITMRKKKCNLDENYFVPFWDLLMQELNENKVPNSGPLRLSSFTHIINDTAMSLFENTELDYWKRLDDILMEKEQEIYKEDLEMEHVIDRIMTMVKHDGLPAEKLDDYNKLAAEEHFFLRDDVIHLLNQVITHDDTEYVQY